MKLLKLIFYSILFFGVGEILIRTDQKFDLLNHAPKRIITKIEETDLLKSVEQNALIKDSNQVRLLILGDSYIHGGGINQNKKFSKKLSEYLNNNSQSNVSYMVLDVSRPSNNTLDNYNSFLFYQSNFQPHLVFWAYNFNDILSDLETNKKNSSNTKKTPPSQASKERKGLKKYILQLYSYSELLRYLSKNFQKELKIHGIIPPFGDFNYLTQKAYTTSSDKWAKTQELLINTATICDSNQCKFLLYYIPEFNLLHTPELFSNIETSMQKFTESNHNVEFINGRKDFENFNPEQLKISKYDGHPNEMAHDILAVRISKYIKEERITPYNKTIYPDNVR